MTKNLTDHEVFWLARHAHNKLQPLIEGSQSTSTPLCLDIELIFDRLKQYNSGSHVSVKVRTKDDILASEWFARTAADIDELALKVMASIEALKLEVAAA